MSENRNILRPSWSSRFLLREAAIKCERATRLVYPLFFFLNLDLLSAPQTQSEMSYVSRSKQLQLGNQLKLNTCSYELIFSQWLILTPLKILTFPLESPSIIFIHLVVCLTAGPKPLPKRILHIIRSRASSFKWKYLLLSLRSSSSFLRLLPRLSVTSMPHFYLSSNNLL
jgi:hypothetical protein